ncbi:MAG TPA: penicillin acylase family protein, partial [Gemmatales bacterium]|nr:penicillin acylase family protein [Gemmatales bacterium]
AILANDMHLGLRVPNFWFRACFHYPDPRMPGTLRRAVGVTLPGTPVLVVGSTGKVAWGFTNTQADWSDLVVVEFDELETNDYRTPQGLKPLEKDQELIRIKDSPDRPMTIEKTIWGPVIGRDHAKRRRALRWVAHDPEGINLRLFDLLFVHTLEEALDVANHCGMPHQNFVVADDQGGIAWTVTGRIPKRQGAAGRLPVSWADGTNGWTGYVPPAEAPRVLRPASGRLWTANNRTMSGPELDMLGFGAYDRGARARQIRDRLADLDQATEKDLLDIQLDNRALFLERWRGLFLKTINSPKRTLGPDLQLARDLVTNWQGRAVPECVGFRLVYDWRRRVQGAVMGPITAACRGGTGGIVDNLASPPDGALWKILEEQPLHLLDPIYQSYDGLLFLEIKKLVEELAEERGGLMARTWGERNEVMVNHPVTLSLGMLGPWLNAPPRRLPGAPADMPRIQGRRFGASERLVVSPGKEEQGLFHMPGGQSGHPGNPNYLNGFDAWANGDATPLLPGPKVNEFTLRPRQ